MSSSSQERLPKAEKIDVILCSSGARAPCFIGALEALHQKGYSVERVAGTSGGALIAASYALGTSLDTMKEQARSCPFPSFKDFSLRRFLNLKNPSIYKGDALDNFLISIFGDKTLSDFQKPCYIGAVSIPDKATVVLSKETHPDLLIWQAVRMSCTIPLIFPFYKLDGVPLTDGALINKIFTLLPNDGHRPVVNLLPKSESLLEKTVNTNPSRMLVWDYLKIVIGFLLESVEGRHIAEEDWRQTITIPTFEISSFNFDLVQEDVERLIQYGYNAIIVSDKLP